MTEMKARLVDKDGNPLGTAANPLKISDHSISTATWGSIAGTLSDQTDLNTALNGKASKTESDLTFYVYEDATGTGDGSSKANGFTALQDAIDVVSDIAGNVTIIVCKGSTNYLGDTTTIQKASVKSLTIQGEFYACEACDANAVAGKIVDASADFSDFEVGDRVVCTHYSGTVESSSIDDYFYATITEVGSGYVQTSEGTKVPTTGWKYLITATCISSLIDASPSVGVFDIRGSHVSLIGLYVDTTNKTTQRYFASIYQSKLSVNYSIIQTGYGLLSGWNSTVFITGSFVETYTASIYTLNGSNANIISSVFNVTNSSSGVGIYNDEKSHNSLIYSGIFSANKAVVSYCNCMMQTCYIASTCTYGAYGYNITLTNCTNNAATPVYNLTSGGSIEEWDGQALPSIADATGGQVLALKSDKSALEFATVDLDTLGGASSTTEDMTVYVDSAATGAGTGVDWTNAFTTMQDAINSLPALIKHAVTIYIRKGSSAYAAATLQRVVAGGSITVRGEYYWNNTIASAGSGAGKFNVNAADTGIAAGDKVYLMKYSGTVNASTPLDAFIDSVASVDGTEVTLTERTSDTFDTSWKYTIVRTEVGAFTVKNTSNVTIRGMYLNQGASRTILQNGSEVYLSNCLLSSNGGLLNIYGIINGSDMPYVACDGGATSNHGINVQNSIVGFRSLFLYSGATAAGSGRGHVGVDVPARVTLSYSYILGKSTGTASGCLASYNSAISVSSVRIDGESSGSPLPIGLQAVGGGQIITSSVVFGSNITTQKSPANWAATTDGGCIT